MSLRSLQREEQARRKKGLPILDDSAVDLDGCDDGVDVALPASRSECRGGMRPCPFVSCRFHLYLDVTETGSIKINFPDQEPWELACSCALDVAEAGGLTLETVGSLLNLTRERTRQVEANALAKIHDVLERPGPALDVVAADVVRDVENVLAIAAASEGDANVDDA